MAYRQLSYIRNKKLGYDKDQVMILQETWMLGNNQQAFRQQILQDPRVLSLSISDYLPAGPSGDNNFFIYPGDNSTHLVKTLRYDVDYNYIPTMGMQLATGRNFEKDLRTDSAGAILNEAAIRTMGWQKDPLDHYFTYAPDPAHKIIFRVIGVVKDFHFRSLHDPISPLVMILSNRPATMIIKTKTRDIAGLTAAMQKTWASFTHDAPMEYSFLDERFFETYNAEQLTAPILGIFATLTIFVACMGLFGLATFTADQRTKEIGIRKVLGATIGGIISLLSKDFLKLVAIAFIIAAPIAWFLMNKWLQDLAHHIEMNGWLFYRRRHPGPGHHPDHRQLPGHPRGPDEPGQKPAIGVAYLWAFLPFVPVSTRAGHHAVTLVPAEIFDHAPSIPVPNRVWLFV